MHYGIYNIYISKMHNNISLKAWGEMELYYCKIIIVELKWYDIT